MVGERVKNVIDREPFWRSLGDRMAPRASRIRNRPGRRIEDTVPELNERNFGSGIGAGTIGAGIMKVVTQYAPIGTEVEIADTEFRNGAVLYTVNVDAPFWNTARMQAFFESASGFTNLFTDLVEIQDAEVVRQRILKDTYQIQVLVSQN